jgi:hypothetical protein
MYDLMFDLFVRLGLLPPPGVPSFTRDILPIFQRMSGFQFYPWRVSRFPVGPLPGYRAHRKERAQPIVRDEFRPANPRFGLVATRARLRFTGITRIKLWRFGVPAIIIEPQGVS